MNIISTVTKEAQGNPTLLRLDPGVSVATVKAVVKGHGGDFNYLDPYGALVFSTTVNKGASSSYQTSLEPGTYVALDLTGNGKAPNRCSRSLRPLTRRRCRRRRRPWRRSSSRSAVRARCMMASWSGSRTQGFLVHMIVGIGVKNAKTAAKVTKLLKAGKDNQAGNLATSFATFDGGLSSEHMQQEVITAKPGIYVLAYFMNTQDGREHTQLGMERTIRIFK